MNKKTLTIIIVVAAILIVGYYGVNRWRQERLMTQVFKELYGVDAGKDAGLLNKITGGNIAEKIAEEIAKEEAKQEKEEAREAAKTPEDFYNETQEMPTYDENSKAVTDEVREIVEKVFGKAKLTGFSTGFYGGDVVGSGVASFEIARLTSAVDVGAINKALTDKGLQIINSGVDNAEAVVFAEDDNTQYMVMFNVGEQEINISIIRAAE